jgi:hypothetical protein
MVNLEYVSEELVLGYLCFDVSQDIFSDLGRQLCGLRIGSEGTEGPVVV